MKQSRVLHARGKGRAALRGRPRMSPTGGPRPVDSRGLRGWPSRALTGMVRSGLSSAETAKQVEMLLITRAMLLSVVALLALATGARAQTTSPAAVLAAAKSWGYQLQKIKPAVIASAPYDVFVIDYSPDGTDAHAFSAADIAALKTKPDGGRRIVLAYLSIGEAETYRYYWQGEWDRNPPAWLADTNKRYRTNILARYWDAGWQAIIFRGENNYLGRILAAG